MDTTPAAGSLPPDRPGQFGNDQLLTLRTWRYAIGSWASQSGTWCTSTALSWVVLAATRSNQELGLLITIQFLPSTFLSPLLGRLSHRYPPYRAIVLSIACQVLLLGLLASAAGTPASFRMLPVTIAACFLTVCTIFEFAARQIYLSWLISDDQRARFTGITTVASGLGRLTGPALAGILLVFAAPAACFLAAAACLTAGAILLPRAPDSEASPPRAVRWRDGLRHVARVRGLRDLLVIFTIVSIVSLNVSLLVPMLVASRYGNNPATLAMLNCAVAIGALIGGTLRGVSRAAARRTVGPGLAVFGIAFVCIAIYRPFALVAPMIAIAGIGRFLFTASTNAALMTGTARENRGTVAGLYAFAFNGTTPFGALLVTWLVRSLSVSDAFALCGMVAVAAAVASQLLGRGG